MIELIHDLAPEAEILFYSGFNGFFDFADGIRALADAGADIIVDDLIYFAEPFFQNGAIAQAVNEVVNDGVVYFSSAGNSGEESYESDYRNITRGGLELHDFDPDPNVENGFQLLTIGANSTINLLLNWDQPSPATAGGDGATETDLDIFVFDPITEELVFEITTDNIAANLAYERISLTNNGDTDAALAFAFVKSAGPNPTRIKWINTDDDFESIQFDTNSSTIFGHANAQRAIAVGAVAFFEAKGFNDRENSTIESFSSLGGTTLVLNSNGSRKSSPIIPIKPDFCATDGTNNTFFGNDIVNNFNGQPLEDDTNPNFFGTSAAAPHAAAVAALMLQADPNLEPRAIRTILRNSAEDMDNPLTADFDTGYDIKTGFGYINARKAVERVVNRVGVNNLALASVCSNNPDNKLRWRIRNSNNFGVRVTWRVTGTDQTNTILARPGDTFFRTNTVADNSNTVRITWEDQNEETRQRMRASNFIDCDATNVIAEAELDSDPEFIVYPNPVEYNDLRVSYISNEAVEDRLTIVPFNSTSRNAVISIPVELKTGENNINIDISALQKGIYFLQIGGKVKKLVKQ